MTEMTYVMSSNIRAIGWEVAEGEPDAEGQRFGVLLVEFMSGTVYRYYGVSDNAFEEFCDSDSPGTYFHTHIRAFFEGVKEETP